MPEFIDDGSPEGVVFGREGGKVALFGGEPVDRPVVAAVEGPVSLFTLRARIASLEQALALLGAVAFDGESGPSIPDPEPGEESYTVLYGIGFIAYYGEDEAEYRDEVPSGAEEGSLYGEFWIYYGENIAVY